MTEFKSRRVNLFCLVLLLLFVTGAQGEPIKNNEIEDLNIIISQIVGGEPNVLIITDLSGSMIRAYGGSQVGNWDDDADNGNLNVCQQLHCGSSCDDFVERSLAAHCAENLSNVSVCGSRHCIGGTGTCDTAEQFNNFLACVQGTGAITQTDINLVLDKWCGNNNGSYSAATDVCGNNDSTDPNGAMEYEGAAAAIEARAQLTECSASACDDFSGSGYSRDDYACDRSDEYTDFRSCMLNSQAIDKNTVMNCTGGDSTCMGRPAYGTTRLDMLYSVIFDFLDADDSLDAKMCDDPTQLFDGTSTSISCQDYMFTPFRNVRQIVRDDGSPSSSRNLPITGAADTKLASELSIDDGDILGLRLRGLTYSGEGNWSSCTSSGTFRLQSNNPPFPSPTTSALQNFWSFFRTQQGEGGTPLAWVLGFDDNNSTSGTSGGNVVNNDALGAFRTELQTDPSISCRPQFVIIITDGEDTCAGDPNGQSGQTSGSLTTNANRRSSIQAVSNLRTYYARNPVQGHKKEILTFVIGVGIQDPAARRTLNAMAIAGGTHTQGIIRHMSPDGETIVGSVNIDDPNMFPQGSSFDVFKNLAKATNIDTSAASAQLQGCKNTTAQRSESGQCQFQSTNIFNNTFFNSGSPFASGDEAKLDNFAFFVNNASELTEALKDITDFVQIFSTSGVSPAAPQSSTAIALRDRIYLSILTPITTNKLWQGRLGLFGFVDVPGNEGNKVVIRRPPSGADLDDISEVESLAIFDDDGTLNDNAKQFYWEAGKNLAERNIVNSPRNLFTVKAPDLIAGDNVDDPPFGGSDFVTTGNVIRYKGPLVPLNDENAPLSPGQFGISNSDVTSPIPEYCVPEGGASTDCNGSGGVVNCTDVTTEACRTCVKECMRDKIVDFLIGNTGIPTIEDPMGAPSLDSTPAQNDGATPFTSMGYNCPDPDDSNNDGQSGSLTTCSLRLGDIFHSNPVVVGSPSPLFFDTGFQEFAVHFKDRSAVVYAGANDGFIHGFHAGELKNPNAEGAPTEDKINPFTLKEEIFPFFDEGTGFELFGVAMPTYLADSLASPSSSANSPADIVFGTPPPPDYRTGDFKTFVLDDFEQRSFADGSPVIGDVFIDGFPNGITPGDDAPEECEESVSVADGEIDVCGREWHTVLLAGSQNGGGAYIALDVTNPACGEDCGTSDTLHEHIENGSETLDYPKHLWTIFDRDFGNTWSTPSTGRVRLKITDEGQSKYIDRWVMFVGGGLDPADTDPSNGVSFGNTFVVVDISTGKNIFKFHPTRPIPSGGSALPNIADMVCDVPSRVAPVDINSDGYTDLAYFGDTCGRMWRFDVSMPIEVSGSLSESGPTGNMDIIAEDWTGQVAFCANTSSECLNNQNQPKVPTANLEPIYFAPTLVLDDLGRRHVIFVTGDRRDPSSRLKSGKLYNFIDDYVPAFLAGGTPMGGLSIKTATTLTAAGQVVELTGQSGLAGQFVSSKGNNFSSDQGEFLVKFPNNLGSPQEGEKGFGVPVVINRVLLFTTYAPDLESSDPCSGGTGFGRIFALDFITGSAALSRIPGVVNGDILSGSADQEKLAAGVTVAEGMPTPAQMTYGARGSILMSVAFTGGPASVGSNEGGGSQFIIWEMPPLPMRSQLLFWEEIL